MFKMIRCGADFCLVIMITPADANPDTPGAKFYRYASWEIQDYEAGVFTEVARGTALGYWTGHADGLGFEDEPEESFPSLEAALAFIKQKRDECARR